MRAKVGLRLGVPRAVRAQQPEHARVCACACGGERGIALALAAGLRACVRRE